MVEKKENRKWPWPDPNKEFNISRTKWMLAVIAKDIFLASFSLFLILSWFEWREPGSTSGLYGLVGFLGIFFYIFLIFILSFLGKKWLHRITPSKKYEKIKRLTFIVFLSSLLILLILQFGAAIYEQAGILIFWLRTITVFLSVMSGTAVIWLNHDFLDETEKQKPDEIELKKEENFWENNFKLIVTLIFLVSLTLHILVANWSNGFSNFHSGESQFYKLIKSFSEGNYDAIYQRSQSIFVYSLGFLDRLFHKTLDITSLRLIVSIATFMINFYILLNLKKIPSLKISKLGILYILAGFAFSHTILFYSGVLRPDIIILTIFNLFLFEYLKNGLNRLAYLILLSAMAVSFKGNGFLLVAFLIAIVNFELVRKNLAEEKKISFSLFFKYNLLMVLPYLIFLLLSPHYLSLGLFSFFNNFDIGLEKFNSGHYGLFSTGQNPLWIYSERFLTFILFFSPIVILYFFGSFSYLYRLFRIFKKINFKKFISLPEIKIAIVIVLSLFFFFFVFGKPIQFYRYYFPLLTVFITISFLVLAKLKHKKISLFLMILFLAYNSYFIQQQLSNSRFNEKIAGNKFYVEEYTRDWMMPVEINIEQGINRMSDLPENGQLLIMENNKYIYDRIIKNEEFFTEKDFYGVSKEELNERINFYKDLQGLNLVYSSGENKIFSFYLPYDLWYMTNANYYIYAKKPVSDNTNL